MHTYLSRQLPCYCATLETDQICILVLCRLDERTSDLIYVVCAGPQAARVVTGTCAAPDARAPAGAHAAAGACAAPDAQVPAGAHAAADAPLLPERAGWFPTFLDDIVKQHVWSAERPLGGWSKMPTHRRPQLATQPAFYMSALACRPASWTLWPGPSVSLSSARTAQTAASSWHCCCTRPHNSQPAIARPSGRAAAALLEVSVDLALHLLERVSRAHFTTDNSCCDISVPPYLYDLEDLHVASRTARCLHARAVPHR